jgi:hypothetical protein
MAQRPRRRNRSTFGIPEWLWDRLDGPSIFGLLLVILGMPILIRVGVEPVWAVGVCSIIYVAYIGSRTMAEYSHWKREEAALNRDTLDRIAELIPLLRGTPPAPPALPAAPPPPDPKPALEEGLPVKS